MADDLASGFQNVDGTGAFEVYASCLRLLDGISFFGEYKRESYERLRPRAGCRLLEVGCGLGDDAAALAGIVGPDGLVIGIDGSRGMVSAARERHGRVAALAFEVADAAELPFASESFDGCRVDRVLQHVRDPLAVVREITRVTRPGGAVVAYDNDWETLTVSSQDRRVTRLVLNSWCDRFPSGWIGRGLVPLFMEAGLRDVVVTPKTLVLRQFDLADQLYCLVSTVTRLIKEFVLSEAEGSGWLEELRRLDEEGRFFCSYTGFLVCGYQ